MGKNFLLLFSGIILMTSCANSDHRKQQFLLKGNEAHKDQNFPLAIHYFQEAINMDSCYAPALNNLATLYYQQDDLDRAQHLYERAVYCDPSFYQARLNLSNTLYELRQYYRGLDVLANQYEQTPDSAAVMFGMGLHLTRLREYDSAKAIFNRALKFQPDNEEILINLGTLNYYQENFEAAKDYLNRSIEINPDEPEAYNTLALIASAQGNYNTALENINKALALNDEAHYLNNKGFILIKLGKLEEAAENINESIVMDPLNAWAFRNKAILRLQQQQPQEALKLLDRAGKLNDWVEDLNYYTGQAYWQLKENSKACESFQKGATLKEKKSQEALEQYCI
jgi:tetratricopeptide (TPR) repeat protein